MQQTSMQQKRWSATLILAVAALGSADAARAQDNYGAIAYSPSSRAHGYSYDFPSREAAEARALNECHKHASDCQVPLWFRNACGALAVGNGGGWGTGWGTNQQLAERYALDTCHGYTSNCSVIRWVCTTR